MTNDKPLQRGDFVIITTPSGQEMPAMIGLASDNGKSIIVFFDGMIGGYAGVMPASLQEDGQWLGIADQMPVMIVRKPY